MLTGKNSSQVLFHKIALGKRLYKLENYVKSRIAIKIILLSQLNLRKYPKMFFFFLKPGERSLSAEGHVNLISFLRVRDILLRFIFLNLYFRHLSVGFIRFLFSTTRDSRSTVFESFGRQICFLQVFGKTFSLDEGHFFLIFQFAVIYRDSHHLQNYLCFS